MTLLLHPCNLGKEGLVVLLHLCDFELLLVFLGPVVISALLHFPKFHLSALNLTLELLNLAFMRVVRLQLVDLLLEFFDRHGLGAEFALQDLILVFEALDLALQ